MEEAVDLKDVVHKSKEWFFYLKTKWLLIVSFGLLGGAIGFTLAYFKKPFYTATVSFVLEDDKSSGAGLSGIASQFGFDFGGDGGNGGGAFSGNNLMGLMKSRFLIERTLLSPVYFKGKQESLAEAYIEINDWRTGWATKPGLSQLQYLPEPDRTKYSLQQDSVLEVIYNAVSSYTTVTPKDKKLLLNSIVVKAPDELFAKTFAEALVKEVTDFYIQTKTKKAKDNVSILQRQTDSVRSELNAALSGVATSTDQTYNLNPGYLRAKVPSQRRQFDIQANTTILTELIKNLELAKVSLLKETPLIQVIDKPILPLPKEKASKRNALILGGFLGGLIIIVLLVARRMWRRLSE
jgi:hypothetical protein